ncbi:Receptor-type guanylate cyclase gcy [Seminavis robusta]|uniref:Receptor-type guanylate cyclase gcy n=1 Tax=Seminavis robusta TaxID=568900 RepID=A0A9N8E487_9STRA|nr:Receptor-type guanylate cyclase gcy [Seminavis robusta]|eukprot:Sro602_g173750.1 Receptor-type guanylate cyclase gcy (1247) ;mRNA; f:34198-39886
MTHPKLENVLEETGEPSTTSSEGGSGLGLESHAHEESMETKLATLEESSYDEEDDSWSDDDTTTNEESSHRSASKHGSISSVTSAALGIGLGIPRYILASKWLVAAVLVGCMVLVSFLSFKYTTGEEQAGFEDQFHDYADEIIDQATANVAASFRVLSSFGKTATSLALFANESLTWPQMTLPHFETRASDFLFISKAQQVAFAPLVSDTQRSIWESYAQTNQQWLQEGIDFEYLQRSEDQAWNETDVPRQAQPIPASIWKYVQNNMPMVEKPQSSGYLPLWQTYPPPRESIHVNYNLLSNPMFADLVTTVSSTRSGVLSGITNDDLALFQDETAEPCPKSVLLQPVFESFEAGSAIVAVVFELLSWGEIFKGILHDAATPVMCVLHDSCGNSSYSYQVSGMETTFLGVGDWHNDKFESLAVASNLTSPSNVCSFTLQVYPTDEMEEAFHTSMPLYITLAVVAVFSFTSLVFLLYDLVVQQQHSTLVAAATKTTAIIGNLFPQEVHERLFSSTLAADKSHAAPKFKMMSMISEEDRQKGAAAGTADTAMEEGKKKKDAPIADLWPDCTVLFCDICGFTAWSSVRQPTQVFHLLESVYNEFDTIAHRRNVFKVETIGDSYLAVTGLPTPREDHAVVMVKFAYDCLTKMQATAQALELELGPGTSELTMRFGLHSGPVTAGVLRGEKTRFQLFGDTVNTASRMESTGERSKIQVSQETADLLIAAGRDKWLTARDTKVLAKGKGKLQTYWCHPRAHGFERSMSEMSDVMQVATPRPSLSSGMNMKSLAILHDTIASADGLGEGRKRSVHWISEILHKILKQILARRSASGWNIMLIKKMNDAPSSIVAPNGDEGRLAIDEVKDIIMLPKFDRAMVRKEADSSSVKIPAPALEQLDNYISQVALLYRDNAFHNFDHATHATMGVSKLLARIVQPELDYTKDKGRHFESKRVQTKAEAVSPVEFFAPSYSVCVGLLDHQTYADHTYGITSDPLTQFACVFAALIHDADHPGCPNVSLVNEQTELAVKYENRSVAEQNSFDLCWNMLMDDKYKDLRSCIYATDEEGKRFRQLVINSIIATDISDKTLSAQRKARWMKAFHSQSADGDADGDYEESNEEAVNRKATIVIEHLIQASDVVHTMQHWHIYIKWNEKLFQEMHQAFLDGKVEKDPSESWYEGELGFYDFYIIPLAKKLKECGVFGVSSAEYLNYATANRKEWEVRGREVVAGYVAKYAKKSGKTKSARDLWRGKP